MPLCHEEILPAVIVVIYELCAPAGVYLSNSGDPGRTRSIVERVLQVSEKRVPLVPESIDEDVRPAIAVVVSGVHTHTCEGLSIIVIRQPGIQRDLLKPSIVTVTEEL